MDPRTLILWNHLLIKKVALGIIYNVGAYVITCGACKYRWRKIGDAQTILPIKCPACGCINTNGKMAQKNILEEHLK